MKLFYRKYGKGPPLIILHGLYGSSDNWVTIAKGLNEIYTVYLPDQRNHGQSPHNSIHDYNSMRDDLFELIKDLKLTKIFLAGHSMGGKTAISFALNWPELLNGLLIADISPFVNETLKRSVHNEHLTILKTILSIDLSHVSKRGDAESAIIQKITDEKVRGFILKNLQRAADNSFGWKLNAPSLLNNLGKIMEGIDRKAGLNQQITGFPVIFLRGGNSDYVPISDFSEIQKVFPAAEFITVPNAGHWIHADRPDEVVRNLKKLIIDS
ncbi:MAG: alpha/beta fold hydrolase [Bacteroidetes bacterium]|nr:MAG: alpha/beta fold hydrolase [Bacteroidota bacterium]